MNVNELLDTIEDTLEESTSMPLSGGKRLVDVERSGIIWMISVQTCPASCGRPSRS